MKKENPKQRYIFDHTLPKMEKDQFVVRRGDKWAVVGANNKRATRITDTQKEAINIARNIAINQQSEMRV